MSKELHDVILNLEKQLMHYRREDFEKLLANDYIEYGSSGKKYDKSLQLSFLNGKATLNYIPFMITDFKIKLLSSEFVHTTYCTESIDNGNKSLRNYIWKLNDGQWQMFFHQGTPTK
ncbi:nuclear transport factor 2 family protein [Paenibacillus sp. TY11]|uniref:nuclear transport factor 2 family protein n=1 Tax=Paenibacillus sp. TY11 TaxID=3448633 RepID=UPI0040395215